MCDVLKGLAAVAAAGSGGILPCSGRDGAREVAAISGMACVFGHMFPVFFSFRGGKGVSTTLGVLFMLDWRVALLSWSVFDCNAVYAHGFAGVCVHAAVAVPCYAWLFHTEGITPRQRLVCVLAMAAVCIAVIIKHSSNIARIAAKGKESRLSFGSKRSGTAKLRPGSRTSGKRDKLTVKVIKANKNIKTKERMPAGGRAGGEYGKEISGI